MSEEPINLSDFRQQLLNLQKDLQDIAASSQEATETVKLDQTRVGRLSRMDALQAQAMSTATERRREESLRRIAAALKRIESNDYGDCLECGEAIHPDRLRLDPAVSLCIQCAQNLERRE
ncbi:MAG: TraR/DksA family transcriptional regulator [Gammaproteobacteria bacterium]